MEQTLKLTTALTITGRIPELALDPPSKQYVLLQGIRDNSGAGHSPNEVLDFVSIISDSLRGRLIRCRFSNGVLIAFSESDVYKIISPVI